MANNLVGIKSIGEVYDYRVALPLVVVAAFGIVFIASTRDSVATLKNSSPASHTAKLVSKESVPAASSNTIQAVSSADTQTLSTQTETEDVDPGQTPTTIDTTSPQASSSSSTTASTSSSKALQNSPTPTSGASSSPVNSNQPSLSEIDAYINGTINNVNKTVNQVKNSIPINLNLGL